MLSKKLVLIGLLTGSLASDLMAGTWTNFAVGDVMLCFRKTGVTSDLVVDAGPISTFTNLAVNQRISITQYTGTQLALVGTNGMSWSATAYFDGTVSPSTIWYTLFSSNPRPALNTQSQYIPAQKASSQHLVVNDMSPIPTGANYESVTRTNNALSTSTAVIEPDSSGTYEFGESYSFALIGNGVDANWQDEFTVYPENTTPANFTTAGTVQRSDFYWVPPSTSGNSVAYLGYFELNTNGQMSYVAYPVSTPTTPVIQSITRANGVSSIRFTTGASGTYTLCGTNNLSAPIATWPPIASTAGNGSVNTLTDASTNASKFYLISAQ